MTTGTQPSSVDRSGIHRCDAYRQKGTGSGICDTVLDEHGQCSRAADHIEV